MSYKKISGLAVMVLLFVSMLSAQVYSDQQPSVDIKKDSYRMDQKVHMKLGGDLNNLRLTIISEENSYRYLGKLDKNLFFTPSGPGNYEVKIMQGARVVDKDSFTVAEPVRIKKGWMKTKGSGKSPEISARIIHPVTGERISQNFTEGRHNVEVISQGHVKKIVIRNLDVRGNIDLRYEDVSPERSGPKKWLKAYAIDPTNLNFTNASVSSVAKGNELWKCVEYNYTTQTCYGEWNKVMDLVPGQEYTFTLTPEDPIFAESTHDADDCYEEGPGTFCTATEVTSVSSDGGGTLPFDKQSNQPYQFSFTNESQLIDTVQECTFYVNGYDSDGNTWTAQFGSWSTQTFSGPTPTATGPSPEGTVSFDCTSHFGTADDESLYDDFAASLSNADGGKPATAYIDYAYVVINFSVQDTTNPAWDNATESPADPATYNPATTYQFNVTWTDNEAIDTVTIEHNFTGTKQNYSITGNTGNVYYYQYTGLRAGSYAWKMYANDTSDNRNETSEFTYTVNKAPSSVNLLLNGTDGDITINNSGDVNMTGILTQGAGDLELYVNGTLVETGPSPLTNITFFNTIDTQEVQAVFPGNENYTSSSELHSVTVQDTLAPAQVTNLNESKVGESWILWNWTNSADSDFSHATIYVNGNFRTNTSNPYYNATSLLSGAQHEISVTTTDIYGNVNTSEVNDTATTQTSADTTPPRIENVSENSITDTSANITWDTDEDSDSRVFYGTSSGTYTENASDFTFTKHHSVLLTGLSSSTTYYYIVNSTDSAGNSNASSESSFTTLLDQTSPVWSNPTSKPSSPTTYSPAGLYEFNVTWTDNEAIDTVTIEHNFTGTKQNYTVTDSTEDIYNYTYGPIAAGSYTWKEYASDAQGNVNQTSEQTYMIDKADSAVSLLLNGTSANITIQEGQTVNTTGVLVNGSGQITLVNNSENIETGTSPLTNITSYGAPGEYPIRVDYNGNENYTSSSETHYVIVNDTITPNVTLVGPANNSVDPDGDLVFTYRVNDTGEVDSCELIVGGSSNKTDSTITKEINQEFVLNDQENGDYLWSVNCTDPAGHEGASQTYNLSVFINEFYPGLVPIICSDPDGTCTPSNVNTSDTTWEDHGTLTKNAYNDVYLNYTQASIPAGATIEFVNITYDKYQETLDGFLTLEWFHAGQWTEICSQNFGAQGLQVRDPVGCNFTEAGNSAPNRTELNAGIQARARFFYSNNANGKAYGTEFTQITAKYTEDTTPPSVELNSPSNGAFRNNGNITFVYTPSDNNLESCSLYGDFGGSWAENETEPTPINEQQNNFTLPLLEGFYTWNVQCVDVANNTNFASNNYTVNITNPDIEVKDEWITFSINESDAIEGRNINIFTIVRNRGNVDANEPLNVTFFNGDPDTGGTKINGNQEVQSLLVGENKTINVTWTIPGPGPQRIYVRADTPFATNGSVDETDETNNEANTTFNVKAYQTSYGNLTGRYTLGDVQNKTLFNFSLDQNSTGNIFVAETGVDIQFLQLEAITRTTSGSFRSGDFEDIDTAMNMTDYEDNVNATWSVDGLPKATRSFNVFGQDIQDVPIINSTNTANFVTGILWDVSDGGTEYNRTQDLVFITEINQDKNGAFGTYDYEIKYPRRLTDLNEGSQDTVTFYYEIK